MQISSVSTSTFIPVQKSTSNSSSVGRADSDQAVLNLSPDTFSSLVQEAGSTPEVRSDVVASFKARIQNGSYPSPDVVAGLANVIGGSIVARAQSADSSFGTSLD
jgi:anti-sigma28 factor (negative regulator of flagellin synthesis)